MNSPQEGASLLPKSDQEKRFEAKREEGLQRYIARRDAVEQISIEVVLERLGADGNQDGDRSKWKVPGWGNIITKGQAWKNVNTNVHKGFGAVTLVQHVKEFERQGQAVEWLENQFGAGDKVPEAIKAAADSGRRERPQFFEAPENMEQLWGRVREYLVVQRGLPPALVDRMHEQGTLYASRAFDPNRKYYYGAPRAVFLGPASAEVREIEPDGFKGCTEGSDPDRSCFQVPHSEAAEEGILAIQEAAVDSLSYSALFPGRFAVSTNGVGRFALQYRLALEAMDNQFGVRLAFDADMAGDVGAQHVFNGIFIRMLLSRQLKVELATIDEWLLSGVIDVTPSHSPHHLFFNEGWKMALPVHERTVENDAEGKVREVWRQTNNTASPSVRMNVSRAGLHERLERKVYEVPVSERSYHYITQTLKLLRERPIKGKDWNDELRRLGSAYLINYEREAKKDFADGVPALPPHLEAFRTANAKVIAAPVKVASPPVDEPVPPKGPHRPSFQP